MSGTEKENKEPNCSHGIRPKGAVDRTLVKPGSAREEMKQAAIDLYKELTGKNPTEEDLAIMDERLDNEFGNSAASKGDQI